MLATDAKHDLTERLIVTALLQLLLQRVGTDHLRLDPAAAEAMAVRAVVIDESALTIWADGIRALRSVARRLKGFRGRPPGMGPIEADLVCCEHVGRLRPWVAVHHRAGVAPDHLTAENMRGVRLFPDLPGLPSLGPIDAVQAGGRMYPEEIAERAIADAERAIAPYPAGRTAVLLEAHLQRAFGSLVTDGFAPVCGRCGRDLGLTPKGKRPRAGLCSRCRHKEWEAGLPVERRRERWRKKKAAERSRAKEE